MDDTRLADAEAFVRRALSHFPSNDKVTDAQIRSAALKVLKALPPPRRSTLV